MTDFTRRALRAERHGAWRGCRADRARRLLDWAKAWAQDAQWKPEKGAKLSMLRWKYSCRPKTMPS